MDQKNKQNGLPPTGEVGKTETFWTRNVKLITFIVTVSILLALFIPIAILEAKDYFSQKNDDRPKMTESDFCELMDRKNTLQLKDFTAYVGREMEGAQGDYRYYYIQLSDHCLITVVADRETGKVERCLLRDDAMEESVDMMSELVDARAYFAGQPYRTMSTADIQSLAKLPHKLTWSDLAPFRNLICDDSAADARVYRVDVAGSYALAFSVRRVDNVVTAWTMQRTNGEDAIDVLHDNVDLARYFAGSAYWNMTDVELIALFERGNVTWEDFKGYVGAYTNATTYKITIDEHYRVLVRFDSASGQILSCLLSDTNVANGKYQVDLMTAEVNLRLFFAGVAYQTMSRADLVEIMQDKQDLKMLDFARFIGSAENDGNTYRIAIEDRFTLTVKAEVGTGKIESCILTDTHATGESPAELMGDFDLSAYFAGKP